MSKLDYRKEIDGLRAMAVLSVLVYHAEFMLQGQTIFQGGFIGVDIFFVLSGYLISRLLLNEYSNTGTISITNFYKRRVRRIMPILFVVMFAAIPFAWMWMTPGNFHAFSESILSSLAFISNFYFYFSTTEYGADSALLIPFLHTWTLSIEEQFYLFFPPLLLVASKFLKNSTWMLLVALAIASLGFAQFLEGQNSALNFYSPLTRFWELFIGALIAYREVKHGRVKHAPLTDLVTIPSLGILMACVWLFNSDTPHPSVITLIPVIATALILVFITSQSITGKIFSLPPLRFIGLISYSAYLWHFPIFAFARLKGWDDTILIKGIWIALTFGLSILSYYLIETPFRNSKTLKDIVFWPIMAVCLLGLICFHVISLNTNGFESRIPKSIRTLNIEEQSRSRGVVPGATNPAKAGCHNRLIKNLPNCRFKATAPETDPPLKVAFVGDSLLAAIAPDVKERLNTNYDQIHLTLRNCPFFLNSSKYNSKGEIDECNTQLQERRLKNIRDFDTDVVLLFGRMQFLLDGKGFNNQEGGNENKVQILRPDEGSTGTNDSFRQGIQTLLDDSRKIVVVYPLPEVGWNVPQKIMADRPADESEFRDFLRNSPITTSYDLYKERTKEAFEILDSFDHPNIYRVYPHKLLCDKQIRGRCITHDEEFLYYRDGVHPSEHLSLLLTEKIMQQIKKIKAK